MYNDQAKKKSASCYKHEKSRVGSKEIILFSKKKFNVELMGSLDFNCASAKMVTKCFRHKK